MKQWRDSILTFCSSIRNLWKSFTCVQDWTNSKLINITRNNLFSNTCYLGQFRGIVKSQLNRAETKPRFFNKLIFWFHEWAPILHFPVVEFSICIPKCGCEDCISTPLNNCNEFSSHFCSTGTFHCIWNANNVVPSEFPDTALSLFENIFFVDQT